jgi:ribose 1,5-bisphosphokinase PhnN
MVSVLVITGPVGVGKSVVLREVDRVLVSAGVPHASVELEELARCWVPGPEDRTAMVYGNLAAVWAGYAAHGAQRLAVGMLLEDRASLAHLGEAIAGAQPMVVRLTAPLAVIEQRLRGREPQASAELPAARYLARAMDEQKVEDHLVDNGQRPIAEVAREILQLAGWLPVASGPE